MLFRNRQRLLISAFLLFFTQLTAGYLSACYTIVAGKTATADGHVLFAHNEDDSAPQVVFWHKVPRQKHAPGEQIILKNGGRFPHQAESAAYLWLQMPGQNFSDSYMNEYGLAIASNQCLSREKSPELTDGGISYWFRRILIEQAHTAREALDLAAVLIDRFGYDSSGRSYTIADPDEAWVLAVVNGKNWVAQRVPDNAVMVIPNYYTIGAVNPADTANFRLSTDLISHAKKMGWYHPQKDGAFNFRNAYSADFSLNHHENINRMWRGVSLLSSKNYELSDEFPFAFQPGQPIKKTDLMHILRDHYENTPLDSSAFMPYGNPHLSGSRPICTETTQYGFVLELRNDLPAEIGLVMWLAPFRPDVHPFLPWYMGVIEIPEMFTLSDPKTALKMQFDFPESLHTADATKAYWQFEAYARKIDTDFARLFPAVKIQRNHIENEALAQQAGIETKWLRLQKKGTEQLTRAINDFTRQTMSEYLEHLSQ